MKTILQKCNISDLVKSGYTGYVLLPVMDDLEDLPSGECVADIKKNRNPGNHRRFFAFIKQTFAMQDDFDSIEVWRKYITMKAGFFDEVVTAEGKVLYWPQSISWDKLDETEFRQLFDKVINSFIRYYGQNLNDIQINGILEY